MEYGKPVFVPTPIKSLSRRTTLALAAVSGVGVAHIYFCQPLLVEMARTFSVAEHSIRWVPVATQIGAALGLMFLVPLGDVMERRSLAVRVTVALVITSVLMAIAPSFAFLLVSSLFLGINCCTPHLALPIASLLAPKEQQGGVIGTVMAGMLVGILAGRTIAGFVGGSLGWRTVYWMSAVVALAMAWLVRRELPECHSTESGMSYLHLMASAIGLFRHRQMRDWAFIGGMTFGAFNAFWTTLVFMLGTPPYHYGARMAGGLGLLAVVSAASAPLMGKIVDKHSARFGVGWSIIFLLASFAVLYVVGLHLWGLALGIVLLDVSAQCGHIANVTRVYGTFAEMRSRAGMAYMVCFFLGGALGSTLGGWGWAHYGWAGVCGAGSAMVLAALIVHLRSGDESVAQPLAGTLPSST
jgi:predicted MFS family arabinose efflux permease